MHAHTPVAFRAQHQSSQQRWTPLTGTLAQMGPPPPTRAHTLCTLRPPPPPATSLLFLPAPTSAPLGPTEEQHPFSEPHFLLSLTRAFLCAHRMYFCVLPRAALSVYKLPRTPGGVLEAGFSTTEDSSSLEPWAVLCEARSYPVPKAAAVSPSFTVARGWWPAGTSRAPPKQHPLLWGCRGEESEDHVPGAAPASSCKNSTKNSHIFFTQFSIVNNDHIYFTTPPDSYMHTYFLCV